MSNKTLKEFFSNVKSKYDISDSNNQITEEEFIICLKSLDYYASRYNKLILEQVEKVDNFDDFYKLLSEIIGNTYFEVEDTGYVKLIDQKIADINMLIFGVYILDFYKLKEKISSDVFAYVAKHLYEFYEQRLYTDFDMILDWCSSEIDNRDPEDEYNDYIKNFYSLFNIIVEFKFYNFPEIKKDLCSDDEKVLIKSVEYIFNNHKFDFSSLLVDVNEEERDDDSFYMDNFFDSCFLFPASSLGTCMIENNVLEYVNNAYNNGELTIELRNYVVFGEQEICVENTKTRYLLRRLVDAINNFNETVEKINKAYENGCN